MARSLIGTVGGSGPAKKRAEKRREN